MLWNTFNKNLIFKRELDKSINTVRYFSTSISVIGRMYRNQLMIQNDVDDFSNTLLTNFMYWYLLSIPVNDNIIHIFLMCILNLYQLYSGLGKYSNKSKRVQVMFLDQNGIRL